MSALLPSTPRPARAPEPWLRRSDWCTSSSLSRSLFLLAVLRRVLAVSRLLLLAFLFMASNADEAGVRLRLTRLRRGIPSLALALALALALPLPRSIHARVG